MSNVTKLDQNILMVENFLSENIFNDIGRLISESTEDDWFNKKDNYRFYKQLNLPDNIKSYLADSVKEYVSEDYDLVGLNGISRMFAKDSMANHRDEAGRPALYGFVIYLNDNFEGGELYYDKKNILYSPSKNSLIIHPTTEEYTHEVLVIKSGIRYTITGFGYVKNYSA